MDLPDDSPLRRQSRIIIAKVYMLETRQHLEQHATTVLHIGRLRL